MAVWCLRLVAPSITPCPEVHWTPPQADDGTMPALPERLEAKVRTSASPRVASFNSPRSMAPQRRRLYTTARAAQRTHARSPYAESHSRTGLRQVHKQAAGVVRKLLAAQERGKGGASLKSLTLAPAILFKKATHAICCETLKCALARA